MPAHADLKETNTTTWGAGTLGHRVGGLMHMYAAEMVGECGITTWQTNSQVVHYTADTPTGPWTRQDVVLPVWGHCPSAALTPNNTVVMWAFRGSKKPKKGDDAWGHACKGGASPCGFAKHGCGPNAPPAPAPPPKPSTHSLPEAPSPTWPRARPSHGTMLREGATTLPLLVCNS